MPDGKVVVRIDDKVELEQWSDYTFDSDFLTPADAFSVTFGTAKEWSRISEAVKPDVPVTVTVDGALQCTGWIDSVRAQTSASSTMVTITGRDICKPLVDANIHPDTPFKDVSLAELVQTVVDQIYWNFDAGGRYTPFRPNVIYDNEANRKLLSGTAIDGKAKSAGAETKRIEYVRPQANEGAFDFLARNLRRFGLWLWGTADGQLVISSPSYSQKPSYLLSRKLGDKIVQVLDATYSLDRTSVPSHVFVRGKAGGKEFATKTVQGTKWDLDWRLYKPLYVVHDNATTAAEALAFAIQEMSAKMQSAEVYECTVLGHTDPVTGSVYAVDTIATVQDEPLGVFKDMWIAQRTFRRSSGGQTTTQLRLLPLGAIQFSDVDAP